MIDIFSKCLWAILHKNKNSQTITEEFSQNLNNWKRSPKLDSHRGAEFYNSFFQKFLQSKNIQHYSRFTDKGPSIGLKSH